VYMYTALTAMTPIPLTILGLVTGQFANKPTHGVDNSQPGNTDKPTHRRKDDKMDVCYACAKAFKQCYNNILFYVYLKL